MKILHTVEFYAPSVGGAQQVVRQLSERLVQRGHAVTVATTALPERKAKTINGVRIEEFEISGNVVRGFRGEQSEIERYQEFLINSDFDVMLNYAAQQWTMDLIFPVIDRIPYRKIMIPCGFSGLYEPAYQEYFINMPTVMRGYDHLVFHADDYRDTNFARQHHIEHFSIIPNGASETEFARVDGAFRERYRIPDDVPILLTVGSHTSLKGHRLCLEAFQRLDIQRAILVIIGNVFTSPGGWRRFARSVWSELRSRNVSQAIKMLLRAMFGGIAPGCLPDDRMRSRWINLKGLGKKRVLLLDPPRADVLAAYQAADLFIFGSNVEYSPLVLYEAVASRTPFVSLACGNAAEIAAWTGGGVVAPTLQKEHGYVDGDAEIFAQIIADLLVDQPKRKNLSDVGYHTWAKKFTWDEIVSRYEELYSFVLGAENVESV
ncbi:MAG: glycosyltransferase family 4 protein [Chloroflexi bacterium]|nr:glycosyltransferase family 4 protein [Chloroflexota bacterium]